MSTVSINRADNGSVGLRFLRPKNTTSGPFEISDLTPGGAAALSGVIKVLVRTLTYGIIVGKCVVYAFVQERARKGLRE